MSDKEKTPVGSGGRNIILGKKIEERVGSDVSALSAELEDLLNSITESLSTNKIEETLEKHDKQIQELFSKLENMLEASGEALSGSDADLMQTLEDLLQYVDQQDSLIRESVAENLKQVQQQTLVISEQEKMLNQINYAISKREKDLGKILDASNKMAKSGAEMCRKYKNMSFELQKMIERENGWARKIGIFMLVFFSSLFSAIFAAIFVRWL